jgi:hypothetical protein
LARRRTKTTEQRILDEEILLYATRPDHCDCGETCHLAAMYHTACPCSHQYRLGAAKPSIQGIRLDLGETARRLTTDIRVVCRAERSAASSEQVAEWQAHAVQQIKQFSYSKKTAEISEYVERHFEIRNGFALGRPVSLFGLISDGIALFTGK